MDYSYHPEGQENRPNLETSRDHQQSQPAIHYQHPQYPPSHHALQPGYHHALGLGPSYIHPLHTGGPALSQESRQGELPRPRVAPSETSSTVPGSRPAVQMGALDYESVLGAGLQVTTSVPHHLSSEDANPDPSYHIQDLSNPSHGPVVIPSSVSSDSRQSGDGNGGSTASRAQSGKSAVNSGRRGSGPQHLVEPPSTQVSSAPAAERRKTRVRHQWKDKGKVVPAFSRGCQTDPLFEELQRPDATEPAATTLPECLCYGKVADSRLKSFGVFASKTLDAGMRFGPFTGKFVKEGSGCYNPSTWEICVQEKVWFYIDGAGDPGNWMNDVRVARYKEEQNLEAFQFYGSIFFRTTRSVEAGAELRVFYSEDYRRCAGFRSGLDELGFDRVSNKFECKDCKCRYTNAKSLTRHLKFEHDKENNLVAVETDTSHKQLLAERKFANNAEVRCHLRARGDTPNNVKGKKTQRLVREEVRKAFLDKVNAMSKVTGAGRRKAEPMKLFVCKKCGKQFPTEGRLKMHVTFHTETKRLDPVCEICGLECKNKKSLKQHMLSHDSRSHQCHHCKKHFILKRQLVHHLCKEHNEKVGQKLIRGDIEDYLSRYVGPAEENEELEPIHPELPKDMLGKRILVMSKKPKVFKCKYCPRRFGDRTQAVTHEKLMHTNSGRFKCEFCPANFMEESRYIIHQRSHTKDRPYKCEDCPRSFASEKALQNHLPEHRGERPVRCDICDKSFRTRRNMTTHRRRQHSTPSVLLKCSFCDKTFKDKKSLARHEQRHKGIRNHVCLTCGKAFGAKYTLQQHTLVHTGEKPFECKVCQKRFSLNHHLVSHMLRHEKEAEVDIVGDKVALYILKESSKNVDQGLDHLKPA